MKVKKEVIKRLTNLAFRINKNKKSVKGITFAQVVILVIVVAFLSLAFFEINGRSLISQAQADMLLQYIDDTSKAVGLYYSDTLKLPNSIKSLLQNDGSSGWDGAYIQLQRAELTTYSNATLYDTSGNKLVDGASADAVKDTKYQTYFTLANDGNKVYMQIFPIDNNTALYVDKKYDDGNLNTGNCKYYSTEQELVCKIY